LNPDYACAINWKLRCNARGRDRQCAGVLQLKKDELYPHGKPALSHLEQDMRMMLIHDMLT